MQRLPYSKQAQQIKFKTNFSSRDSIKAFHMDVLESWHNVTLHAEQIFERKRDGEEKENVLASND